MAEENGKQTSKKEVSECGNESLSSKKAKELRVLMNKEFMKKLLCNCPSFVDIKVKDLLKLFVSDNLDGIIEEIGIIITISKKSDETPYVYKNEGKIFFHIRKNSQEKDTAFLLGYFFLVLISTEIDGDIENKNYSEEHINKSSIFANKFLKIIKNTNN